MVILCWALENFMFVSGQFLEFIFQGEFWITDCTAAVLPLFVARPFSLQPASHIQPWSSHFRSPFHNPSALAFKRYTLFSSVTKVFPSCLLRVCFTGHPPGHFPHFNFRIKRPCSHGFPSENNTKMVDRSLRLLQF